MSIDTKLIGKRVKEVRVASGMPQMLLAEKSDISVPYLSYIECGKKAPSLEVIVKIAMELNTSVDSLLEGNQTTYSGIYEKEIVEIMFDCSPYHLYLPLLGTGKSRAGLSHQESYELIIQTMKKHKNKINGEITIVVHPKDKNYVAIKKGDAFDGI